MSSQTSPHLAQTAPTDSTQERRRVSPEMARVLPVLAPVVLAGGAVTAAAAVSFVASGPDTEAIVGSVALLAAAAVAEAFPVPIEGVAAGRTSLATVFIVAAASLYGWAPATLVAVLSMAGVELVNRKRPTRVAYNSALYGLSAVAAGVVAGLGGGGLGALVLRTVLAATAFYLVNILLLAAIVSRASGQPLVPFVARYFRSTGLPFGIMASLTVILVALWDRSAVLALALVPPLAAFAIYERRMYTAFTKLRELDRLKDEFIAVVSHELRTPLASVYGAAMTLQRPDLDSTTQRSMLDIVYRESARLARLVDQVLWASRLESGRAEASAESLDPTSVAHDVVEAARAHLPDGLTLDFSAAADMPPVAGDVDKIRQVLVNLVENAVKYSPDGGRVEVGVDRSGRFVRFTVTDEGLGIPAGEQRRIFEKFHRLDPNQTRGVGGTGLGLYISDELVRLMQGQIWVTSEVGKGSSFAVELPRADLTA
jgi:signal transduction histidine kinase